MEGDARKHQEGKREGGEGEKAAGEWYVISPVTAVDNGVSVPPVASGGQQSAHSSGSPHLSGEGAGVFIHQFSSVAG